MKPTIFIDMDDTLVGLSEHIISIYNKELGENFDWKENTQWMWTDADKVKIKYFHNILDRKQIFEDAPILGGLKTRDYINDLIKYYDTYIITSPRISNYECYGEKIRWLKMHKFKVNPANIIFIQNKGICAAGNRILIDDKLSQLESWNNKNGISIAFNQKWNLDWKGKRINQIHELDNFL